MGRPEPCVLFAQTFAHPHLDEYVDEVVFAEPVVVTACEFLELSASSTCQSVSLVGATSPPSFALEVFVQCNGETRFRRLCQPFLYSHSSSNVLDVEAVVTNHLVVRGSYRSLSLVIYGNTAEDLGQFNIEFDDSSLTNITNTVEGELEDLPMPLRTTNFLSKEFTCSLNALPLPVTLLDMSLGVKQLLQLILRILERGEHGDAVQKALSTIVSAVSTYTTLDLSSVAISEKCLKSGRFKDPKKLELAINEATGELLELYKVLQQESVQFPAKLSAETNFLDMDIDSVNLQHLVDMFGKQFHFESDSLFVGHPVLSKRNNSILWLSMALLFCSAKESCFHFVSGGGFEQLVKVFCYDLQNSTTVILLFLGVVEQATRYSVGCEGFLGWWPREEVTIPSGISENYTQLLKLLLQEPRHDVASLATYILRRLRFYEVAAKYECAVLSVLRGLSTIERVTEASLHQLMSTKSQLRSLLKLINLHSQIEDPSPVARASRSLILGQGEGCLSYKMTSGSITSNCCLSIWDIDPNLLGILKERGFLPLSAALLSSSILHLEVGHAMFLHVELVSSIGAIIFSLLLCRSGLLFLAHQPELSSTIVHCLKGGDSTGKDECLPLRYASNLLSKGFSCGSEEVGMILEMHLRVVNAIDHLLTCTPHSEEFLWVLWELCALSRSGCGHQALLVLGFFPEAIAALIEALRSVKESEPSAKSGGASPLDVAIFHSAAEIFEIIVTDSTASSLGSWIERAVELHGALHSSSQGSNRKDAPTRLLEWIDAGVVYHKNGAVGLLRYAAVLASGGDAHLTSTSILVSDLMDVEHAVGDPSGGSDINVMENLGKIISEKTFDGVALCDSSVAQLTTAFRILAFISENSTVAATLYDEGAVTVVYTVLINCRFMLERSSNSYDYLVDDGTECNSTSDLLLERNREQSLIDFLIPALILLINLLKKLQEANEQHRNTKLMNALLRLHRELSPRLAACAADLSAPYPDSALGFEAVCHLIVSSLAYWPVFGWAPGLFHSLLASVQVTSVLALGPKETCSFMCLLNDLFPEEGIWLWKKGMPVLSSLRMLAIGTLLGCQKEKEVNWYLKPEFREKVLSQLTPQLDKIAQMIKHYAVSALVVIQDMLRIFIIRIACQKVESAFILLKPIFSWVHDNVSLISPLDIDNYKVYRYLDFLASLLEHPRAKALLFKAGMIQMLKKVLERCLDAVDSDKAAESRNMADNGFTLLSWCLPVFKSLSLLCSSMATSQCAGIPDLKNTENFSTGDCASILPYLFKFFQVLPVGKELLACVRSFKEISSCKEGRDSLMAAFGSFSSSVVHERDKGHETNQIYNGNESGWSKCAPLLCCWKKMWSSSDASDDSSSFAAHGLDLLSSGCLSFCVDGNRLNLKGVGLVKLLFGLSDDMDETDSFIEENLSYVKGLNALSSSKGENNDHETGPFQIPDSVKSLLLLLVNPIGAVDVVDIVFGEAVLSSNDDLVSTERQSVVDGCLERTDELLQLGGLGDKFLWECPETLPDKTALPLKRKMSSLEGQGRRGRGENAPSDLAASGAFSRGSGQSVASSGPTRRDTFRLRKPNTSRPPSMHVDDYVARERNVDGVSDVIAVPRVGSTSGRPPSIHVDEFMARQRERQSSSATIVGEAVAQVKNAAPASDGEKEVKIPKQLKTDLDDDLQGIDIVFDGEESETDDKMPFPQPDNNLQPSAPVTVEQSSPHSIVEETESDAHESSQFSRMGTPVASNADENTQSEFSSRMSVSRLEKPLTRESSVTSDKRFFDQSNDITGKISGAFDAAAAANHPGFPVLPYAMASASSSGQPRVDSRMSQTLYPKHSPHHAGNLHGAGTQGSYDQKYLQSQPPLPPMPPPSLVPSVVSQASDSVPGHVSPFTNKMVDGQSPVSSAFHVQSDRLSPYSSSPSRSIRPLPPLPPTPPPFLSSPYNMPPIKASTQSSGYVQTSIGMTEFPRAPVMPATDLQHSAAGPRLSYPPPPLMPPLVFSRPASVPVNFYGNNTMQQHGENQPSILQNFPLSQSPMQSVHTVAQLQPLQPPQLPQVPQPPQHLRPLAFSSQQPEQGSSLQNPVQQGHQLQALQQSQVSPMHAYIQSQQDLSHGHPRQEVEHARLQVPHQQGDTSNQQQDLGISLYDYFKSPEDIQALLSDREKLCQLLEQHPKLMQMLQERLGHL
ncbi:protein virilizer homolog [Rhodamnia argentea]|uniref:Protein virilizer homolog n=1 Tax=Rhodamnia argentea TaxID=178133 RepID=A0A8B8R588_9MYRT|nr:protein virilizer homolog [Rhodamnia argentea]